MDAPVALFLQEIIEEVLIIKEANIMSPLEKRGNETEFDYHKRLVYGKLKDKTLADYDYAELAPYVYGQDYSVDVARRMMYGSCRTLEKLGEQAVSEIKDGAVLSKIKAEKVELQKERQKFYDQRREYNKLVNNDGRYEYLYDKLIESANNLANTIGYVFDDAGYVNKMPVSENEAVLVFSDWHYGMVADNIFNKYDTEICKQRVNQIVNDAIDRMILHKCRKAHIVLLGDFIHGCLRASTRVAAEELTCDQLMQVSEIIAQSIFEISNYVQEVEVYSTYGNHARAIVKKEDSIHRDNWERLIPWWLEQRILAEESRIGHKLNITIAPDTGNEFLFLSPCGIDMCAAHGDLDGVRQASQTLTTLFHKVYGKDIQYVILGDKHHRETFESMGVTAAIVGSLAGSDEYANTKRLYSTQSQLLLIVNPDKGVDAEYVLRC